MRKYLSVSQIAQQLGITASSLVSYKLPPPDAMIGRTRGWTQKTIDEWNAMRPGKPGRPRSRFKD